MKSKNRPARGSRSILLRLALLAFVVFCVVQLWDLQTQLSQEKQKLSNYDTQIADQSAKNAQLSELLQNGTDNDLIVEAARDKLYYVYPNEQVFQGK